MKKIAIFCALLAAFVAGAVKMYNLNAAPASPAGIYYNIADEGEDKGKAASHIQVWVNDKGVVYGKIVKLLLKPQDTKCDKCEGNLKNQPVVGMVFLRGLKYDASDNEWSGGYILDPNNGKWYKCFLKVKNGGKKLEVRGFIGVSLLGRTQTWYRVN